MPVVGSMLAVELLSRVFGCESAATARRACFVGGGLYLAVGAIPALLGLVRPVPGARPGRCRTARARTREPAPRSVALRAVRGRAHLGHPVHRGLVHARGLDARHPQRAAADLAGPLGAREAARVATRVLTMGVCAWALALRTESIKDLVETASAFGSAGVFVVACFGLFTTIGGPLSAWVGLCTGFVVWAAGATMGWPAPYVTAPSRRRDLPRRPVQQWRRHSRHRASRADGDRGTVRAPSPGECQAACCRASAASSGKSTFGRPAAGGMGIPAARAASSYRSMAVSADSTASTGLLPCAMHPGSSGTRTTKTASSALQALTSRAEHSVRCLDVWASTAGAHRLEGDVRHRIRSIAAWLPGDGADH